MQFTQVTKLYLLMVVTVIFTACTSDDIEESSTTEATEVKATEIKQSEMFATGFGSEEDPGKD